MRITTAKAILGFAAAIMFFSVGLQAGGLFPINWGFECCPTFCNGAPTTYGYWSYDYAPVVEAENGITPYEGTHMVKFVSTLPCSAGAWYSELYQLLDASSIAADIATGTAVIYAEYYVNRVAGDNETDTAFKIIIYACSGPPSQFNPTAVPLDSVSAWIYSDSDPGTWERVGVWMNHIPVATTYLAIGILAFENVSKDDSPEFDGHYGDDVRVYYGSIGVRESSWGAIKDLYRN